MTDKLRECPFCGGEAKVRETGYRKWDGSHRRFYIVECQCCCANIEADTKEEAIKAWNKRSYIDEIVEQLEEEKNHCCVGCYEDYDPYEDGRFETYEEVITLLKGVQNE